MKNLQKMTTAATAFESAINESIGNSNPTSLEIPVNATTNPEGEFGYSLKKEGVTNFVAKNAVFENGSLHFSEGLVVSGQVLGGSLLVHGTLIVRPGAVVNSAIRCNRLISMGEINSPRVVVQGLVVAWAGNLKTKEGLFCEVIQTSNFCNITGPLKDISEVGR